MNIVIDTNIFISALIKDGAARSVILKPSLNILFPEVEFEEIKSHKEEIMAKSKLSERELYMLILRFLNYVKIIPTSIVAPYRESADKIIGAIDSDDVPFIATALAFNCPILSEDKHFKAQNKVKIITIKEMLEFLD